MKNNLSVISLYSFGHFYVDFVCSFILSLLVFRNPSDLGFIAGLILLYNVIAFGAQPFFGFLIDCYGWIKMGSIFGLGFTFLGSVFFFSPFVAVILLGIGNALYHVGGGVVALNLEPSRAKYPGIYVAPGALGLFLGGFLGYLQIQSWIFLLIGFVLTLLLVLFILKNPVPKIKKFKEGKVDFVAIALLLLLVSVCMRALIGYSLNLEWRSLFLLGFLLTFAIASGKFFGGIVADRYGFMRVGILGLIVATPLLVFFQPFPLLVFLGAFCFNMVMPITLTAIAEVIPNYKGFAFGFTTLSLISGYLLFLFFEDYLIIGEIFTFVVLVINIGSLYFGLKKYKEVKNEK